MTHTRRFTAAVKRAKLPQRVEPGREAERRCYLDGIKGRAIKRAVLADTAMRDHESKMFQSVVKREYQQSLFFYGLGLARADSGIHLDTMHSRCPAAAIVDVRKLVH